MNKEYKSSLIIKGAIICILLNFGGKLLAEYLKLPLWLDTTGTVLAAYAMGPFCGAIVGATSNIMYGAIDPAICIYAITGILTGVTVGICTKKKMFSSAFLAASIAMIVAGISAFISVFLNFVLYDGMTGNIWGDGVICLLDEIGIPYGLSCFAGEFCVDLLDRFISILVIFWFIKVHSKRVERKHAKGISAALIGVIMLGMLPTGNAQAAINYSSCFDSYIQKVFNKSNGIPGSEVNAVAQTRDGLLWIGTYGGLYQYDGLKFSFMSRFDSVRNVNCLYTDEEGRLLIGTNDSGVSISANNEIVNVIDRDGGLPTDSVRSITKSSDGIYYVGTSGAMCTLILSDGMKVKSVFDELGYVTRIAAMENGYVAAVSADGILAVFQGGELKRIYGQDEDENSGYTSVYYDGKYLYTSRTDGRVEKCEFNNDVLEVSATYNCSALKKINDMRLTDENQILLCADNGIGCIDENGQFGIVNTFGFDNSIDNILVDYQNNIWFSSSRLGLLELSKSIAEDVYTKAGFEETVVNAVIKWNGRYFFGTDTGLSIADERLEKQVQNAITAELNNVRIRCLLVDKNNHLWITTSGQGVYEIEPSGKCKKYDITNGLVGNKTRGLIELENGTIAVAADNGISFIQGGEVTKNIDGYNGLATSKTLCLYEFNNAVYAGTDGGGMAVIRNGQVVESINKKNGLSSDVILRIAEASDGIGLFVICSNGLNFIDKEGNIRQLNKFPYYDNFDIIKSENGKIWVTSSAGVYIVEEQELLEDKNLDYELLDSKKGLQSSLIANAWNYVEDGKLFLCCSTGVLVVNMNSYDTQKTSYRITLQNVNIDGVLTPVDKEEINYISRDAVRIEFLPLVINYSVSDPLISVWLEGFDSEPKVMYQHEIESITYTNLSSGEYTFHLAVLDNDMESIMEEISYSFVKENEIYDNWWFGLYLITIGGLVAVYFIWLIIGSQISKNMKIQKKELENLKLKQEANAAVAAGEAKDKFLALMSHDIRTPINAILGMNEMIMRESSEQHIYEYASDIKGAGNNLLSIVNTILDFSKIEEGKMEIIPARYETRKLFNNLINGIAGRAKNKGLEFKIQVEENIPSALYGDDVRLSQVISNLLTNAVKYTNSGYVCFKVQEKERTEEKVTLYVEVTDSGIGIKKEDMGKLFEDFTRLEEKKNRNIEGTGLGMSIVSSLLKMMDSKIEVESTYGVGSKFYFEIEQKIVDSTPVGDILRSDIHEHKKEEKHISAPNASILVVDDNKLNLKVVSSLMKINHIVPDTAMDGYTALAYMKKKHYDIVFLDHMMPELDGIETFKRMVEQNLKKNTKVIILTANAINGARDEYMKEGFDDYLAKPVDGYLLEQKLRKYLSDSVIENADIISDYDETKVNDEDTTVSSVVESNESEANEVAENGKSDSEKDRLLSLCPELDFEIGMRYCMGSMEFYNEVLKEYLDGNKSESLENYYSQKDIKNYRILIHALKSNSMSIGAVELSERAKALEMAAKEQNIKLIESEHGSFIKDYKKLLANINEYFG